MKTQKYDKLIRDKVPELIKESGATCVTEEMDEQTYFGKLLEKLKEEVAEFVAEAEAENDEVAIKELADVEEVVLALVDAIGLSRESFERIRHAKLMQNGGFEKKILLKEVISE